jgi:hypothetical protein
VAHGVGEGGIVAVAVGEEVGEAAFSVGEISGAVVAPISAVGKGGTVGSGDRVHVGVGTAATGGRAAVAAGVGRATGARHAAVNRPNTKIVGR